MEKKVLPTIIEPNGNTEMDIEKGNEVLAVPKSEKVSRKAQFEAIKSLIPNDAIEAMNQFNEKQNKGTIDIWWLTDDGGLTILIPYILSLNDIWRECSLRILTMVKDREDIDETKNNLTELISKLRIPFSGVLVFAESDFEVNEKSKIHFEELISKFVVKKEMQASDQIWVTREELNKHREITNRHLKLSQLLVENTIGTTLVVMTLPAPNQLYSIALYMCWLEVITENMPPFLLVRGNQNQKAIVI